MFGQTQDDVINNGITIDYYVVDNATDSTVSTLTWASDFVAGRPDADYQWSVQTSDSSATTSAVSSFTSASSSATASSKSGSSSSTTAIGVGVGVGVGCAVLLALAAVWWIIRRRRRADDAQTVVTEPHHELKARSGSFDGGFVPYATTTMSGHGAFSFARLSPIRFSGRTRRREAAKPLSPGPEADNALSLCCFASRPPPEPARRSRGAALADDPVLLGLGVRRVGGEQARLSRDLSTEGLLRSAQGRPWGTGDRLFSLQGLRTSL